MRRAKNRTVMTQGSRELALGKVGAVLCSFWFLGVPSTLAGKWEHPPLTNIEKVGCHFQRDVLAAAA